MYKIKLEVAQDIKKRYKTNNIAKEVGISLSYMSMILTQKRTCNKKVAYCLTKWLDPEAEIENYFDRTDV